MHFSHVTCHRTNNGYITFETSFCLSCLLVALSSYVTICICFISLYLFSLLYLYFVYTAVKEAQVSVCLPVEIKVSINQSIK